MIHCIVAGDCHSVDDKEKPQLLLQQPVVSEQKRDISGTLQAMITRLGAIGPTIVHINLTFEADEPR